MERIPSWKDDLYLAHHGVKGQKWGIRRYQNEDGSLTPEGKKHYDSITSYGVKGGVIPKNTALYRVSLHKDDPTFDNKKYVSTNKIDNALWEDYLVNSYKARNKQTYAIKYKTLQDIKVAPDTVLGKKYVDEYFKNPQKVQNDINKAKKFFNGYDASNLNTAEAASLLIAAQTDLGKSICNQLLNEGYNAVSDTHGANTAYDPLIILNPDKNIRKVSTRQYDYQ